MILIRLFVVRWLLEINDQFFVCLYVTSLDAPAARVLRDDPW